MACGASCGVAMVCVSLPSAEPQASISLAAMPLTVMMGTVMGCVVIVCAVLCLLCWRRLRGPR